MPAFSYQPARSINDPSQLSENWHPAYLVAISDEATPEQWAMYQASPRLWRWWFAVWEHPSQLHTTPECQTTPTSQKFSPGGKYQPSKAYLWTCKLLGRSFQAGESVNLDTLMPLPCKVYVKRTNTQGQPSEFANITDLSAWPEGQPLLTPELRQKLAMWLQMKRQESPAQEPPQGAGTAHPPVNPPAAWPAEAPPAPPATPTPKPLAW
jgi:hypothetical protein